MSVTTRLIVEGTVFSIFEIVKNNRSRVEKFFDALPEDTRNRLTRYIVHIANHGLPRNEQRFKHEKDKIYAIKQGQVRIYCFLDDDCLILLTHGALKKKRKANPEDLKRATLLREEYLKAKKL